MKSLILVLVSIIMLCSCGPESQNKYLTYQNIVILSDMSSRLKNRQSKDLVEIREIIKHFKNECVKPGEKIGDKSSISFSSFSDKVIVSIDINRFKNLGEKQRYINSTGEFENIGLIQDLLHFERVVAHSYDSIRNDGLDLISALIEKIENEESLVKRNSHLTDGVDTTFISFENNIHVFTDGYLEYIGKQMNSEYYYGVPEMNRVRHFCKKHNVSIKRALEMDSTLCLPIKKSEKFKFVNLHIRETHERDKREGDQFYKNTSGFRDNEILEAVWRKWAEDCGFKSFHWSKY